jgi:hypothetical protein
MSLRKAINDKCRDCVYDPLSGLGGAIQQIDACTCTLCPLYRVRPRIIAKRPLSQALGGKAHALLSNGFDNG